MTQAIPEIKKPFIEKRIKDIESLQELNRFACMKVKSHRDWYLECMECPGKKSCPVGKQAELIMEKETKPSQEKDISQETDPTRITIVNIFEQEEPVKALLKAFSNLRPPSLYAKVNAWRRRHPDLEDRYHMIEKVRFLWRKQYESMTITDILKELYPDESHIVAIDVASMHPTSILSSEPITKYSAEMNARIEEKKMEDSRTEIAPNSPVITLKPKQNSGIDEDSISLEDFLAENGDISEETSQPQFPTPNLDFLLNKLREEKHSYEKKISELDRQIEATLTVKRLLNATEQQG